MSVDFLNFLDCGLKGGALPVALWSLGVGWQRGESGNFKCGDGNRDPW